MDFLIGAGLLAAGLMLQRLFDAFWPSMEAERERKAWEDREEREARRRYRADLVKPLIDILDGVSIRTQKAQGSEMMRKLVAETPEGKQKIEELGFTPEYADRIFGEESQDLLAKHAYRVIEEEIPLVSRVTDDGAQSALRRVLLMSLIPGMLETDSGRQAIREAYKSLENWVSSL